MNIPTSMDDAVREFLRLFQEVREKVLSFESESLENNDSESYHYASDFWVELRDAMDDFAMGYNNNNQEKIANAMEHLRIIGGDVLEITLLNKIRQIDKIRSKLDSFFNRKIYPRKVYSYIASKIPEIKTKLTEGRRFKSTDYETAKRFYEEGIQIAQDIIDKWDRWEIPGMKEGERKKELLLTIFFGFIIGLITGFIINYLFLLYH